jgi:hypothetical protein
MHGFIRKTPPILRVSATTDTVGRTQRAHTKWNTTNHDITMFGMCWREKKKQIMMAQGAGARGGRNDPLKTIPGARLKTAPSSWPELDSLERACWGGVKRSRSVDGQVRGGLAMLPAEESRQPGCFLAQTVQAPFVFDSDPGGMLYGAGLLWPHPTFQLCPHPRGQLYEEPSGETGATVAGDKHKPTVLVGNSATQARTQRTGAGYSVEDVRQQTHTRPESLDKSTRFRVTASGEPVLVTPDSGASDADSGENSGELDTGESDAAEQEKESPSAVQHKVLLGPKDYKRLKHGKDAPFDAELQYLKPQLLAQALVHHKFVMDLPDGIWIDEKTGKTAPCRVMAVKAYSSTQAKFWYVDFTIISHADCCDLQLPVRRGTVKSVNHAMNLQDLFRQIFNHPSTLEDLGITEDRSKQIMSATIDAWRDSLQNPFALACVLSSQINAADAQRKEQEQAAAATRSAAIERKALEEARARGPPAGHFKQVMETCEPLDTIFDEIDLLEDDPPHRGVAMRNARFRPYWIQAEEKEWQGLWEKGVFKKWSRKDLLSNDRVFTSRYVYKLKRSAITGEVYRFKARLIVRGFQVEKGVDFDDSFSPTSGLAVGRFMLSLAVANDYELHACDIEQAFLQADKIPEGVNGRYFIQPPPGSPDANNRDVVYEVRRPLYGNPSSPRALHKTLDAYFMSEGFEHVGFEESVWVRPKGGKYGEDIYFSTHVDDCLICCKSTATMSKFKQELLTRFQGTDEGEVKEYLGCEVIRDRAARTGKMVQAGYAERVLRTFGMWNCNPVLTPLDPNVRLTRRDSPEVVDPRLHRRMRSIVGCLSYLVNMTRPDLAFTYSQLSKFVQSPGPVHLAAAERALAYLRGTYNEGITYCDPGEDRRNKLTGWVDSDFAADPDTRKSMTGYLFSLNGGAVSWRSSRQGAVSWRSSRQGGVTLSSAEAEFVAASQAGQEAVYLRALLRGFNFRQVGATEIWEDNASCIMMSENPANRERTRHVDTRVHYLRELVRDGHVKLLKCAGPQNVADALTKSLPRPALAKHRQYMWGTRIPFSAFYLSLKTGRSPTASYNIITPCGYQVARAA